MDPSAASSVKTAFVLQSYPPPLGVLTDLSSAVYEAAMQRNWLSREEEVACFRVSENEPAGVVTYIESELPHLGVEDIVPVGSVEFVNSLLAYRGFSPVYALNIPPELDVSNFLHRRILRDAMKLDLSLLNDELGEFFVKPGRHPKRFPTMLYDRRYYDEIPNDEPLFISQMLPAPIVAEWRLFLKYGQIVSARPYVLDVITAPRDSSCVAMALALKDFPAITLDIAVLNDGRVTALEVHNFLACGLYGFEGPEVLTMSKAAWKYELELQRKEKAKEEQCGYTSSTANE